MSKLIEALRGGEEKKPVNGKKSQHELTQEQLADIYFPSVTGQSKKSDTPMVIKVIEKSRPHSVLPWIISSIAFLLLALSLFTTKRVFIDVKVIDDKTLFSGQEDEVTVPADNEAIITTAAAIPVTFLNLDRVNFEGAAKIRSAASEKMLTLVNSSVASFARADYEFKPYRDLLGKKIVFYARGQNGGEAFAFSLRDRSNVPAFKRGKIYPFENGLTTQWQKAEIILQDTVKEFDPKEVATMRFDFGSKDTSNRHNDTIFIKEVQIVSSEAA